jgi:hypothetical protein
MEKCWNIQFIIILRQVSLRVTLKSLLKLIIFSLYETIINYLLEGEKINIYMGVYEFIFPAFAVEPVLDSALHFTQVNEPNSSS